MTKSTEGMEATTRVVSRSSKVVPGRPEIPLTVQVVIQAGKLSVTKHLRYEHSAGGQYVGRAYDYRKRQYVSIAFPLAILSGSLKEEVQLRLAA